MIQAEHGEVVPSSGPGPRCAQTQKEPAEAPNDTQQNSRRIPSRLCYRILKASTSWDHDDTTADDVRDATTKSLCHAVTHHSVAAPASREG